MTEIQYGRLTPEQWVTACQAARKMYNNEVPVTVDELEAFIARIQRLEKGLKEIEMQSSYLTKTEIRDIARKALRGEHE